MNDLSSTRKGVITETVRGVVDRITYHNSDNGFSILRVSPFNNPHQKETVIVHQCKVFAGASMEFSGAWTVHNRFGRQFKANSATELKPATTAALEKYLGSGLIKGVGPKTAKKIVKHFGQQTLEVFEDDIDRLMEVTGIAKKKLQTISEAWVTHKSIRQVMIFLQSHGISTLFAVRIYKEYGDHAIAYVQEDPYRLANDFYGIGFFSADKIALSIGLAPTSLQRIMAGIRHVLAASRDFGHCYLTQSQIEWQVDELLDLKLADNLPDILNSMAQDNQLMSRMIRNSEGEKESCYYSKSLYFDELYVAKKVSLPKKTRQIDRGKIDSWLGRFIESKNISLSEEQTGAVKNIVCENFSILTGGPGCGKTTTTLAIVKLLENMGLKVLLAAPTGRAAQRMSEVIGNESKTIHRLLEWQGGKFKKSEATPLDVDFLIVDECSMLDISLTASLLKAVPKQSQVLFIGDADQLPSVGAGNVLKDMITCGKIPCFHLKKIFRQARKSLVIKYAHQINRGEMPYVDSPFKKPHKWQEKVDCLFIDAEEATQEQIAFINKVKSVQHIKTRQLEHKKSETFNNPYEFRTQESIAPYETEINIPKKFQHVDLQAVCRAKGQVEELMAVLTKVHPWSSLHYGLAATSIVRKLYTEWIPKYFGKNCEIQILTPMTRGSLGSVNLNKMIQQSANPPQPGKSELVVGERVFRVGDRVIHRRNNYELGVFNGDIGVIEEIDNEELTCSISFLPDYRQVLYQKENIVELDLAYSITIHKSQGSEFEAVIIPVVTQHFKMLYRNLIYTGLTRARKLAVFVGTRKALAMAIKNQDTSQRQTALQELIVTECESFAVNT